MYKLLNIISKTGTCSPGINLKCITQAAGHFRSSPWSYSIANSSAHVLD